MKNDDFKLAIVGANENYGAEILSILVEMNFSINNLYALGQQAHLGRSISYGEVETLKIESAQFFDFSQVDLCIFASSHFNYANHMKKAIDSGTTIIDTSTMYNFQNNSNLILPGINSNNIPKKDLLYSTPSSPSIHLLYPISAIHDEFGINKIIISACLSVSELGREAMDELFRQTKGIYTNEFINSVHFPKRIAFNIIPQVGDLEQNLNTDIENLISHEINTILDKNIEVNVTCLMAPVFVGNTYSLTFELDDEPRNKEIQKILEKNKKISFITNDNIVTATDIVTEESIYVMRLRQNSTNPKIFNMIIVADNLKAGAPRCAIEIMKLIS